LESFLLITGTKNRRKLTRVNIFEALSLSDNNGKNDAINYQKRWGSDTVNFADEHKFAEMFKRRLQVWRLKSEKSGGNTYGIRIFGNGGRKVLNITVDDLWNIESEAISITDNTCLVWDEKILNYFECSEPECKMVKHSLKDMQIHCRAHNADRIYCEQAIMDGKMLTINQMKLEGIIPHDFKETLALFWDIESLAVPSEKGMQHVPISIGVCKNFGQTNDVFLLREDMSAMALQDLITDFVDLLELSHQGLI